MDIHIDISNTVIETERLILRPWQESDLDDFYAYASVSGVGEMAGWPHHQSKDTSRQILHSFRTKKLDFAIYHKQDKKVIGSFGIGKSWATGHEDYKHLKSKKIGYVLAKDYWGQGLVPEAAKAVIDHCFTTLGLDAITIEHFISNHQSRRVIEKCGFQYLWDDTYYSKLMDQHFEEKKYILFK